MIAPLQPKRKIGLVIPLGSAHTMRPGYWEDVFSALRQHYGELVVVGVRLWALPGTSFVRAKIPGPGLVLKLLAARSDATICVEYSVGTLVALVISRLAGRPCFIFQEHAVPPNLLTTRRRLFRRLLTRLATGILANTPQARQQAVSDFGASPETSVIVPLLSAPRPKALLVRAFPTPSPRARPVFLYVGRLIATKNVGLLLDAADRLSSTGQSFEVWLAGDGPERPTLEAQRARLHAGGQFVRFLGPVDYRALGHVYRAADVFVMPTLRDYRSVSVLEALTFGLPVIDSLEDGNAGTTIVDHSNGLLFDPHSVSSLASAMAHVLRNGNLALLRANAATRTSLSTIEGALAALDQALADRHRVQDD